MTCLKVCLDLGRMVDPFSLHMSTMSVPSQAHELIFKYLSSFDEQGLRFEIRRPLGLGSNEDGPHTVNLQ